MEVWVPHNDTLFFFVIREGPKKEEAKNNPELSEKCQPLSLVSVYIRPQLEQRNERHLIVPYCFAPLLVWPIYEQYRCLPGKRVNSCWIATANLGITNLVYSASALVV